MRPSERRVPRRALLLAVAALVGCSTILYGRSSAAPADPARAGSLGGGLPRVALPSPDTNHLIRVALRTAASTVRISSTGVWRLYDADGRTFLARGMANEPWLVEHDGRDVRAIRSDGMPTVWKPDALVAAPDDPSALMIVDGRRYYGQLRLVGTDTGLVVIETVGVEEYLRGVVPLELGDSDPRDSAAIEAQAVTARSYAYTHLAEPEADAFDLTAGTNDQVYGGVDAETAVGNAAVAATGGIVITYGGRVVNAPYHSTCGGETAAPSEVWHSPDEPYLRPVSDRIPGTDRYYCDISPRFRWQRTLTESELNGAVARYLSHYASVPGGDPGLVRDVMVVNRTPSGRVGQLRVETTLGSFILRGNDMRYVLRPVGGEILNSTYFSVAVERTRAGALARLVLDGRGYGHGVGMCQWGAIGRARAGQDFRTILRTYYPGTALGVVQ
jgi:stage II sporulation protein D (peptidoglycan lytic transglycosylase)